ncbi:MAG: AMP-binding protein [Acidimicrobiales bacterium]|jgi:cyclohexanecarboxylate-CoA ligase
MDESTQSTGGRFTTRIDPTWAAWWRHIGAWRDELLGTVFSAYCRDHRTQTFVIDGAVRLTFGQFDNVVSRLASGLGDLGIGLGDTIAFQLPSWWEAIAISHAAFRLGAVVAPIGPNLRAHELRYILDAATPKALFVPHLFRGVDWNEILRDLAFSPAQIVGVRGSIGSTTLESLISRESGFEESRSIRPVDPALLLFTSGSTSAPKGVLHGHNDLLAEARSLRATHDVGADDVMLMPYPVTHIGGFAYGVLLPFVSSMRVVLMDIWDAGDAVRLIEREQVTFLSAVPGVIDSIVAEPGFGPQVARSVRLIAMGGTRVTEESVLDAARAFDSVCKRGYGLTEMPTFTSTPADADARRWATSDGTPTGPSAIRIVDDEGRELPNGISGEILAQGPELFLGYLDPSLNEEAFTQDGWFRTGDLGVLDERGAVHIDGRKKDIIIRNGENISAAEVEELLLAHPAVVDVAVVGIRDPEVGERACAVVVPAASGFAMEQMVEILRTSGLAKFKFPERLELRAVLPMTANGKIRKDVLRDELETQEAQRRRP